MTRIFIDGKAGTTGLKIFSRFQNRPELELIQIDEDKRKDPAERAKCINDSDITFLCLPDPAAIEAVALVTNPKVKLIDTSTAHRTLPDWAYGFPELAPAFREKIASSNRIAVPGCYASGFNALIYPLVSGGILPADYPIVCYAMSGYSGAGNKGIAQYEAADRDPELDSPRQYALTQQHKHLKEMGAISHLARTPIFAPHICDYPCGMTVSVPLFADLLKKRMTPADMQAFYAGHYGDSRVVKVRPLGYSESMIGANNMAGRDDMEIEINGNDERLLLTPPLAVSECRNHTVEMAKIAREAFTESIKLLGGYDRKAADRITELEQSLDDYEDKLGTFLVKISGLELTDEDANIVSTLLHTIGDFERIGDHALNLVKVAQEISDKGISFSDEAKNELMTATKAISEILDITVTAFCDNDAEAALRVEPLEQVIDKLLAEIKDRHIARLTGGSCTIELGFVLSDILTNYERVSDHCSNIAVCIIQIGHSVFDTHEYLNEYKNAGGKEFTAAYDGFKKKYALPGKA